MFKAMLVIFVLGIGKGHDEYGGSLNVVPFQTMDQCKEAVVELKKVTDPWHYGDDKSNKVPIRGSIKCVAITPVPLNIPSPTVTYQTPSIHQLPTTECPPAGTTYNVGDTSWGADWGQEKQ